MDSQNEEVNPIFGRFRSYLWNDQSSTLIDEFNEYRRNWSKNKFRLFLSNALVLMRSWSENQNPAETSTLDDEDWDRPQTFVTVADRMENAAYDLFLVIVDYLQDSCDDNDLDLWKRIIANRWTIKEKFYIHLHQKHISLPNRLTRILYNELYDFYVATSDWSSTTKIILIDMGFVHFLINDNVFLGCNHVLSANGLFKLENFAAFTEYAQKNGLVYHRKLINAINTPEKMKIFLDTFPNVNVNECITGDIDIHQQRTGITMLDRLLKMESYFYDTFENIPSRDQVDLNSADLHHRTANIVALFVKLIEKGAKISIPLDATFFLNHRIPFYLSTIGFYLLSIIRYSDMFLVASLEPNDDDNDDNVFSYSYVESKTIEKSQLDLMNINYVHYLIKRASTFTSKFRSFFCKHLILSTPYLHSNTFYEHVRTRTNVRLRLLYDELLEHRTSLTLKQRCRLKIKESINNYPLDVKKFSSLPVILQNYLSFDLFHPNLPEMLIFQLEQAEGRLKPSYFDELQFHEHNIEPVNGHYDWEDQIPDEVDQIDDLDQNDDDEMIDDADLFDEEQLYDDNHDDDEDEDW